MFTRIVVGADGTPEGQDAIVLGAAIAAATGAGLTLIEAFAPFLISSEGGMDRQSQVDAAERRLRTDRHRFAPEAHIETVADSNPARALRQHAERWNADLVVIGSSRRAPEGRCAIGRTGRRLIDYGSPALAIAKRGLHEEGLSLANVAVGYDGGPESERALHLADAIAQGAGAELLIQTITHEPIPALVLGEPEVPETLAGLRESERLGALELLNDAAASTVADVRVGAGVGEAGPELRALSESVDLMVIGSRRWGTFARVVLGGVGETLVADCASSLVVASRPPGA